MLNPAQEAALPPSRGKTSASTPKPSRRGLHEQAELQLLRRRTGRLEQRLLPLAEGRGFALLPRPSEGDPFWRPARVLNFLFGLVTVDGSEPSYEAIWGHDRDEERRAFEKPWKGCPFRGFPLK